jgi:shikimate dehydrogenase
MIRKINMLDHYGVIGGNQVKHSLSPVIHQTFAKQTGQLLRYEAIPVEHANQIFKVLHELHQKGFKGFSITMPFKESVYRYLKDHHYPVSERAENVKAVNTLMFLSNGQWQGDNTDGIGIVRDIVNNHQWVISGKRILVCGAGGAARGVVSELMRAVPRPQEMVIANRTLLRGKILVDELGYKDVVELREISESSPGHYDLHPSYALPFDLIVNAIAGGSFPELPDRVLAKDCYCYDLVYKTEKSIETAFLAWVKRQEIKAPEKSIHATDGLGMLVEQAAEAFYIWRGVKPDTQSVIAMLR